MTLRRITSLALICGSAALLIWLTLAVGVAGAARQALPELALKWFPADARANAEAASRLIAHARSPADLATAEALARFSVARDPTYAPAVRTLGLIAVARRDQQGAASLVRLSSRLSRRDLPTSLWLIEERVQANDIVGALHHYDIALRTSDDAEPLLFPILISASADANIAHPLARLLATKPIWAERFMARLIPEAPSSERLVDIVRRMGQERALPIPGLMRALIDDLAGKRKYDLAWQAYVLATGNAGGLRPDRIRNGEFDADNPYPPFDWLLSGDSSRAVRRQLRPNSQSNAALFFNLAASTRGMITRQALQLAPGRYRLSAVAGSIPSSAGLAWQVTCLGDTETPIYHLAVPAADDQGRSQSGTFEVPGQNCPTQLLYLNGDAGSDEDSSGWVDSVSIVPERAAS